jgi:hypothetical protein
MREKYVKVQAVDEDEILQETEPQVKQTVAEKAHTAINVFMTVLCFVLVSGLSGGAGWFARLLMDPPVISFSQAQEEFERLGYMNAAQTLGEIDQICPNGRHQKISCRLLLLNVAEIAQRGGGSEEPRISQAHAIIKVPKE